MKKRYLLYMMVSCTFISRGSGMEQAASFFTQLKEKIGTKKERKEKKPSLKKDIVHYSVYWAVTPAATFIGALSLVFCGVLRENNEHHYIILKWFSAYLIGSILVASLCTCWRHFTAKKESKTSLKDKFVRFFLFISSSAWTPVLIIVLSEGKFIKLDDPKKLFIPPFFLSSLLTLGVVSYDYIAKK